jgi:acetoacetyl-CoA synthetase
MERVKEGVRLWTPPEELREGSNLWRYMRWLKQTRGLQFDDYEALWRWSVEDLDSFWASVWEFFEIQASSPYETVLADRSMPGAKWFPGARLNYAEHLVRHARPDQPAIIARSELRPMTVWTWQQLLDTAGAFAGTLRRLGVREGDRVVAYLPNIPETLAAFIATASLGAVWSSCAPEFGTPSVVSRFRQIEPKVLLTIDGYSYQGKAYDRMDVVAQLQRELPTVERTILIPYLREKPATDGLRNVELWAEATARPEPLTFTHVPFDHPLWVLYSSGTTGLPKPIVQGHGGCLLVHLVMQGLHSNLGPDDRFFWFTTTGWMMWNVVVASLLTGSTALLYDGSPAYPDMGALWQFAADSGMSVFGTSAGYITSCMKADLYPGRDYDLSRLKVLAYTGSPLAPDGFAWVYERVKPDIWLYPASGGTDVCSAFVLGSPLHPVHAGEIPCRALGAKVECFDDEGKPLIGEVGELVVTAPYPSMPLYFWNDPDGTRYRESYFDTFPGVWRHGDLIKITERGSAVIYGRSDATINRQGVRIGTSEIYAAVESLPEVLDSLIIDTTHLGREGEMLLFVVLRPGQSLTDELTARIRQTLRETVSPRHVPDAVYQVPEVPRTLNGKKLEVPIRKIFLGMPVEKAVNRDAMGNPEALKAYLEIAAARGAR